MKSKKDMLRRCGISLNGDFKEYQIGNSRVEKYIGCSVDEEWLNYDNFKKWWDENYYELPNEKTCIDKDLLIPKNKIYSKDTCVIVPNSINLAITLTKNKNGYSGVFHRYKDKYYTRVLHIMVKQNIHQLQH